MCVNGNREQGRGGVEGSQKRKYGGEQGKTREQEGEGKETHAVRMFEAIGANVPIGGIDHLVGLWVEVDAEL